MMENDSKYSHRVEYYKYKEQIVGVIPSLDKIFAAKEVRHYPTAITSKQKPLFHESYKRRPRIKRVFVLTNACNMHCSYCFEGNHSNPQMMSDNLVKSSIEEMFREAIEKNISLISFSLFGGEPTMNWRAVETAITVATELERLTGIRCYKAIVTNGVMLEEHCKYLSQKMDFIYFSFDGPKKLFLQQRKPKDNMEVYDAILRNANLVYNAGTYLSFKVTVSKLTIDYLKEIDDFFAYRFPTCSRLYQPCMVDINDPLYIPFGFFLEKYYDLKRYSVFPKNMTTSLHKNTPSDRFCNLMIRNVMYPDGNVLSCHRSNMCIPDDKVKATFHVGYCNDAGQIQEDKRKRRWLEKFTVKEIPECRTCPFRYHCCGGCATIKLLSENANMFRKADYCNDYLSFIFTDLFARLHRKEQDYLAEVPIKINFDDYEMEWGAFEEKVVDKIISMEERADEFRS